jgi:hypothetical protein
VIVAEEGEHGAPGVLLDGGDHLTAHRALKGFAAREHQVDLAVAHETALAHRQRVLEDDRDQVLVDVRARSRGTAARVLAHQLHHRTGDR